MGAGGISWIQGGPKPCDAKRGDAAMLLIFPLTGLSFLSWSQNSSPSSCPLSATAVLPGGCHPSSVPQPCGCWCWTFAQPRGWWWDRDGPTTSKTITWALVAVINRGTGLCQGNPPPASVGHHPVGAQGCSKGRQQHICCLGTPAQAQVYN